MPVQPQYSIVMIYPPRIFNPHDYVKIANRVKERSKEMLVHILPDLEQRPAIYAKLTELPSLTFCPMHLKKFRPPRGKVFCGQPIAKSRQMRLLAKSGVRVPRWTFYSPDKIYSESEWGRFVIVKPDAFGYASKGRGVELVRTSSLRTPALTRSRASKKGPMIVQRFLDTGPYSEDYRVVTLFGSALYALKRRSLVPLEDLDSAGSDRSSKGVVSNAEAGERDVHYCYEKDVLAFAAAVYRAIPEVPFQAIDVRRDRNDGRLYCLEINPGGKHLEFLFTPRTRHPDDRRNSPRGTTRGMGYRRGGLDRANQIARLLTAD